MICVHTFFSLSYVMFVPVTFVMLRVEAVVASGNLLLVSLQLPVGPVMQL